MKNVYVGMSGGVDSSLTAAHLNEKGYNVTGVYMKNWTEDLPGMRCPWADDLADAKRVAVQLGIDFKVFDFQTEYKQKVVDYMIAEYQSGRTPNPDIMCNQEIKFKLFLETSLQDGADMIATGHYARVKKPGVAGPAVSSARDATRQEAMQTTLTKADAHKHQRSELIVSEASLSEGKSSKADRCDLLMAADANKDQTYFLYRVNQEALDRTLFPLGEYKKSQVREMAKKRGLITADKKDSQGICFVGKADIRDFLKQYVNAEPGAIIDKQTGKGIGMHEGAIFYTFGQRHGLNIGGGLPYYVVGKNMQKNEVYVTTDLNDEAMWLDTLLIENLYWIHDSPKVGNNYRVRLRHRAPLVEAVFTDLNSNGASIKLAEQQRAITPGQSVVVYDDEKVLGGGMVT